MAFYRKLSVEILGDKNRVEVLRFLFRNKPNRFSQKQISDSLNITPATTSRTCRKLEELDVVDCLEVGRTILYRLNSASYIVSKFLEPIFEREATIFHDLVKDILTKLDPNLKILIKEIILFGSTVVDEDTPVSDIDLAIVFYKHISTKDRVKDIEEHFLHQAVEFKIHLDTHFFIEGKSHKGKGISLEHVYDQGVIIWRNDNENSSEG